MAEKTTINDDTKTTSLPQTLTAEKTKFVETIKAKIDRPVSAITTTDEEDKPPCR